MFYLVVLMEVAFTKMSQKGQVVIPSDVRHEVDFSPKDKFIVYGLNDTVIIKKVNTHAAEKRLAKTFAHIDARDLNLTPEDIEKEIRAVRNSKSRK